MATVEFDLSEIQQFFSRCQNAAKGDFKRELEQFLDGLGMEFLRILEEEIVRKNVMRTRLLANSAHKGGEGNVWEITDGGLTLEVGTNVEYAKWVNDGHRQQPGRFIPGYWNGDEFVYQPGASTGMVLKASWVPGAHYWDSALNIMDRLMPQFLERKLQGWLDSYFGG